MVRLLALLALAVSCVGCCACGGPGCCGPVGLRRRMWMWRRLLRKRLRLRRSVCLRRRWLRHGCCDTGCAATPVAAANVAASRAAAAAPNCGGGCCAGGCCGHALADCPICQDCRNCRLFRRGYAALRLRPMWRRMRPMLRRLRLQRVQQCQQLWPRPRLLLLRLLRDLQRLLLPTAGPRLLCLGRPSATTSPPARRSANRVSVLHGPRPARFPDGQPAVRSARIDRRAS